VEQLLHEDQRGEHEERTEDVRVLEERLRAPAAVPRVRSGKGQKRRQGSDDRRDDCRDEESAHHEPGPRGPVDPACQPDREHSQVGGDEEELSGAAQVDRLDGGQHVEDEEQAEQARDERRHSAQREPAGDHRYSNGHGEHEVRRRRLDEHDSEEHEAQRDNCFEAGQRKPEQRDQREASGKRLAQRRRAGGEAECKRTAEEGGDTRPRRRPSDTVHRETADLRGGDAHRGLRVDARPGVWRRRSGG